jgi:hypothetical protein
MFPADPALVTKHIVLALLQELDSRSPGLASAVEARLNSATKTAEEGELADLQQAARIVGEV